MSPIHTAALAVLIVTLGLIASVRFGNAGRVDSWQTTDLPNAADVTHGIDAKVLR